MKLLLLLISVLCPLISAPAAVNLGLSWDASPDSSVAGYNIYYGPAPGVYTNIVPAGAFLSITISNLPATCTYFTATAYDITGTESEFSNEVHWPPYPKIFTGRMLSWPRWEQVEMQISLSLSPPEWFSFDGATGTNYFLPLAAFPETAFFRLKQFSSEPMPLQIQNIFVPDPRE